MDITLKKIQIFNLRIRKRFKFSIKNLFFSRRIISNFGNVCWLSFSMKERRFHRVKIMRERGLRGHCRPYRPLWLKVTADARQWWIIFRICPAPGGESSVLSFWFRRTILSHLCSSIARSHYVSAGAILPLRFLPLCFIRPFFIDIFSYFFPPVDSPILLTETCDQYWFPKMGFERDRDTIISSKFRKSWFSLSLSRIVLICF